MNSHPRRLDHLPVVGPADAPWCARSVFNDSRQVAAARLANVLAATVDSATRDVALGDAYDEPDTGKPPCDFCRREIPCECGPTWLTGRPQDCMCTCGRCMADDR